MQSEDFVTKAQRFNATIERLDELNLGAKDEEEFVSVKEQASNDYEAVQTMLEAESTEVETDQELFDEFVEDVNESTAEFDVSMTNLFAQVSRFPAAAERLRLLTYVEKGAAQVVLTELQMTPTAFAELTKIRDGGDPEPLRGYTLETGLRADLKMYAENMEKFSQKVIDIQDKVGIFGGNVSGKLRDPAAVAVRKRVEGSTLLEQLKEAEAMYKNAEKEIMDKARELVPDGNFKSLDDVLKPVKAFLVYPTKEQNQITEAIAKGQSVPERRYGSGYVELAREWASVNKANMLYGTEEMRNLPLEQQRGVLPQKRDTLFYLKSVLEKAAKGDLDIGTPYNPADASSSSSPLRVRVRTRGTTTSHGK